MKWCRKHKTILGCVLAGLTFVALHVAVPAGVATWVAHPAHASNGPAVLYEEKDVKVILVEFRYGLGTQICVVGIAQGRMAKTIDVECP